MLPIQTIVEVKPWWQSRTLWVNFASGVGFALEIHYRALRPLVSPEVYQWLAILIPVVNAALRAITTAPLSFRPRDWQ